MRLKTLEISGFKSFAKKAVLGFDVPVTAIVGPNGSGKSNVAEAFRFVLGEQSVKSLRGKKGEDLIFGGGKSIARQNRASVKVVFENAKRRLPIDFDEVSLERVVHRDGFNEYLINDSRVRLKDIIELLAHANIGSTGHHIISQGEADRILSASPVERREMIEDALGLKIYHYRKKESKRKLEKTEENIKQVESLRREIAPHLNFLRKQVEKLEKGRELKEKLEQLYFEYFKREGLYISFTKKALEEDRKEPDALLKKLESELKKTETVLSRSPEDPEKQAELRNLQGKYNDLQAEKDEVSRDLGRIEGELAFIARMQSKQPVSGHPQTLSYTQVKDLTDEISHLLKEAQSHQDLVSAMNHIKKAQEKIHIFFESLNQHAAKSNAHEHDKDLAELNKKKEASAEKIKTLIENMHKISGQIDALRIAIEQDRRGNHEAERMQYEIKAKQNDAVNQLSQIKLKEERLMEIEAEFKRELGEAGALIGHRISEYVTYEPKSTQGATLSHEAIVAEARNEQEERKRSVERMKIRLEDAGLGTGEEVLKEHKETTERDEFLKKEIQDLSVASDSLKKLIAELDSELKKRFDDGIVKINDNFGAFFSTMFGGGEARLDVISMKKKSQEASDDEDADDSMPNVVVDEDDEEEEQVGIEAFVSLPHKRIKGLVMLSGGERALTSIALLFAVSQVNPPPFVILDETDAALDEANSRKYGDMITSLAKHSQLILITHNRETMSRAGVLYGVTMSSEGYSTLLSIRFEEALKVAK